MGERLAAGPRSGGSVTLCPAAPPAILARMSGLFSVLAGLFVLPVAFDGDLAGNIGGAGGTAKGFGGGRAIGAPPGDQAPAEVEREVKGLRACEVRNEANLTTIIAGGGNEDSERPGNALGDVNSGLALIGDASDQRREGSNRGRGGRVQGGRVGSYATALKTGTAYWIAVAGPGNVTWSITEAH